MSLVRPIRHRANHVESIRRHDARQRGNPLLQRFQQAREQFPRCRSLERCPIRQLQQIAQYRAGRVRTHHRAQIRVHDRQSVLVHECRDRVPAHRAQRVVEPARRIARIPRLPCRRRTRRP
jgi:hypothetical protein